MFSGSDRPALLPSGDRGFSRSGKERGHPLALWPPAGGGYPARIRTRRGGGAPFGPSGILCRHIQLICAFSCTVYRDIIRADYTTTHAMRQASSLHQMDACHRCSCLPSRCQKRRSNNLGISAYRKCRPGYALSGHRDDYTSGMALAAHFT